MDSSPTGISQRGSFSEEVSQRAKAIPGGRRPLPLSHGPRADQPMVLPKALNSFRGEVANPIAPA